VSPDPEQAAVTTAGASALIHPGQSAAASGLEDRHAPRKALSLIVLVYNEQDNLTTFYERLDPVLASLPGYEPEIIFVDDGSRDNSLAILRALRERDRRIRILKLSRNFGSWSAVAAGVHAATGDGVMWITSDLQDPPELIPQLVRPWENGADVVWALRTHRDDPLPRRLMATLFYTILRRVALPDYPPMGMDICLMDRRVARLFAQLKERNRFTQALIMNLGFTQVTVPYKRERRHGGQSKWGNLPRLSKMGTDMIVGTSSGPIRAMTYGGACTVAVGVVLAAALLAARVVERAPVAPWLPIALAILIAGGLNALMLGVLGEYLWRVLEEVRDRPLYIVQERIGFNPAGFLPDSPQQRDEQVRRDERYR
jgi:polyisoprenyl-phosphate glycosyltransferase